MTREAGDMPDALRWAMQNFAVDRVTAEVTRALDAAGVASVVVKGPAIATWLYAGGEPRLYSDSDLLIRREDWARAQAVVESLGFEAGLAQLEHPRMESGEGYPWGRAADAASIDLHCTIFGLGAGPEAVWRKIAATAVEASVGGARVRFPSHAARLLHIAIHAVQHGGESAGQPMRMLERRPMVDLELAIERAPAETWQEALELARELDGVAVLAAGLAQLPRGRELAGAIGVDEAVSTRTALRLAGVPLSEGFAELAELDSSRQRLALVAREAFPSPVFMRWWSPLARRGRLGLWLSYPWRLLWLAFRAGPGFLAWRRAARAAARENARPVR